VWTGCDPEFGGAVFKAKRMKTGLMSSQWYVMLT
jgi:hypothetical protein